MSKPKKETKKKKEDAASVIYDNQDIVKELKKKAEAMEDGKDKAFSDASNAPSDASNMPPGASNMSSKVKVPISNMPSKGGARTSAKTTPSSKRKSAPINAKPMVLSTKPKPTGRARPKTTRDGRSAKPSGTDGRPSGTDGGSAPKKSVKKEQLYQNVVFDENDTPVLDMK